MVKQSIDHSSGDIRHLNQSQREEIKQSDNTVNEHYGVLSDKPGQSQGPKKHVKKKKGTNDQTVMLNSLKIQYKALALLIVDKIDIHLAIEKETDHSGTQKMYLQDLPRERMESLQILIEHVVAITEIEICIQPQRKYASNQFLI